MILSVPPLEERGHEWPTLGPQVCAWIEKNLVFGPGDLLGQPARLDDEKRGLVYRMYEIYPQGHEQAGRRRFKRVVISLRKGSAKTEFAAWIAAAELAPDAPVRCEGFYKNGQPKARAVRNPYIPMCAYTEEQGEELAYGALLEILRRSKIADRFDLGLERIIRIDRNGQADGKAEAVASAPNARDGARTTFQHFDETHRFVIGAKKRAHQTMQQNIPKRRLSDAWSLETTTAYLPGERSVAEEAHHYALSVEAGQRKDSRLFYFHRQAGDAHDLKTAEGRRAAVLEASGPAATWSDVDGICAQADDPTTDITYWERVWCNRPVKAASRAFDVKLWASRKREGYVVKPGALIVLGFDGSRYNDATGIVATEVETGFQFVPGKWERPASLPPNAAWEVPQLEVEAKMRELFETFVVLRLYADPPYWETVVAQWSGEFGDERVVMFPTNRHRKMSWAVRGFANAITDGSLSHDGDPDLARHVGNCHRRDVAERDEDGRPLFIVTKDRPGSPAKIDHAVAGVLSWEARQAAIAEGLRPTPPELMRVDVVG